MYHSALPFQWSHRLPQPALDTVPRSNSPLYFTGCSESYPLITLNKSSNARKTLLPSPTLDMRRDSKRIVPEAKLPSEYASSRHPIESPGQSMSREKAMSMPQLSIETLNRVNMEHIKQIAELIDLTNGCNSQPATKASPADSDDCKSIGRGVKRHFDSTSQSTQKSVDNLASKRQKYDDTRIYDEHISKDEKTPEIITIIDDASEEASPSKSAEISQNSSSKDFLERVSKLIWEIYMQNKQSDEMYMKKTRLRDELHKLLKNVFPFCGLYIVGSSLNGLGTNYSDLDMCLMLTHSEIDQEFEATSILGIVLQLLDKCDFVRNSQLIPAKVPILKFFDTVSCVEVDLNINNAVGIRNTQLMDCYARLDWRVQPLVLLVKMWAKDQDINDAKNMTLSSYSLVLMVMHFLQFSASPPVIPCLQEMMPNKFLSHSDVRHLALREELPPFHSNNESNLGELMLQFLDYYSNKFQFKDNVISVRTGGVIPKHVAMGCRSPKNKRGHWKYISIEEPFDRTNTARSVFNETAFNRILAAFRTSFDRLKETRDLSTILDVDYRLL